MVYETLCGFDTGDRGTGDTTTAWMVASRQHMFEFGGGIWHCKFGGILRSSFGGLSVMLMVVRLR